MLSSRAEEEALFQTCYDGSASSARSSGQGSTRRRILAGAALAGILATGILSFLWLCSELRNPQSARHFFASLLGVEYLGKSGVVLQRGELDCGPAAMEMVFQHHGLRVPLEELEKQMLDKPTGTSMLCMKRVAERYGFRAEGWHLTAADFERIPLPAIALWDRKHYVVVESRAGRHLTILDPATGRWTIRTGRFVDDCNGEALLLWRSSQSGFISD